MSVSLLAKYRHWLEPGSDVINLDCVISALQPQTTKNAQFHGELRSVSEVLETTYYRIWALDSLGEGIRNWRFTLDWMLSESRGNSMIWYFIKSHQETDRYGLSCNLFFKKSVTFSERRMFGIKSQNLPKNEGLKNHLK